MTPRTLLAGVAAAAALLLVGCSDQSTPQTETSSPSAWAGAVTTAAASYQDELVAKGGAVLSMTEATIKLEAGSRDMDVTGLDGTRFIVAKGTPYIQASVEADGLTTYVKANGQVFERLGVSAARAASDYALLKLLVNLPEQAKDWSESIVTVVKRENTYEVTVKGAAVADLVLTELPKNPTFQFTLNEDGELVGWGIPSSKQQQISLGAFEPVQIDVPADDALVTVFPKG